MLMFAAFSEPCYVRCVFPFLDIFSLNNGKYGISLFTIFPSWLKYQGTKYVFYLTYDFLKYLFSSPHECFDVNPHNLIDNKLTVIFDA